MKTLTLTLLSLIITSTVAMAQDANGTVARAIIPIGPTLEAFQSATKIIQCENLIVALDGQDKPLVSFLAIQQQNDLQLPIDKSTMDIHTEALLNIDDFRLEKRSEIKNLDYSSHSSTGTSFVITTQYDVNESASPQVQSAGVEIYSGLIKISEPGQAENTIKTSCALIPNS